MEKQCAIELLKIAAQLTVVALDTKTETENTNVVRKRAIEGVFEDCLKSVKAHFVDLTGGAK